MSGRRVWEVLLPDGWHPVEIGSFEVFENGWGCNQDEAEFRYLPRGGASPVYGPLSSVLAVRQLSEAPR